MHTDGRNGEDFCEDKGESMTKQSIWTWLRDMCIGQKEGLPKFQNSRLQIDQLRSVARPGPRMKLPTSRLVVIRENASLHVRLCLLKILSIILNGQRHVD
jgi:hypothetical protein